MNSSPRTVFLVDSLLVVSVITSVIAVRSLFDAKFAYSYQAQIYVLLGLVVWITCLFGAGCYNTRIIGSGIEEVRSLVKGSATAFLLIGTLAYIFKKNPSRLITFVSFLVGLCLLVIGRKLLQSRLHRAFRQGLSMRAALVLGSTQYANDISTLLKENPEYGYKVIGRQSLFSESSLATKRAWFKSLDEGIESQGVAALIIEDTTSANPDLISSLSWHLNKSQVEVLIAPTFLKDFGPRLELSPHRNLPLMFLDEPELSPIEKIAKRLMDIVFSAITIVLLSPVMAFIALGIMLTSRGPILYKQKRIGLEGEEFNFIKFRTMIVGADKMRQEVLGTPDAEMKNRYKNDPRIYPFGRILRRFSLDEIPQFFSVLIGKMTLVGPRPLLIEELDLLEDEDHRRHLLKPGLTGLWQISGRKETSWNERIQLDLQYVHNWSLGLDFIILIKTVNVVLSGRGSY